MWKCHLRNVVHFVEALRQNSLVPLFPNVNCYKILLVGPLRNMSRCHNLDVLPCHADDKAAFLLAGYMIQCSIVVLGPVTLTFFPLHFKFHVVSLSSRFWCRDRYKILCMTRQLWCRGMCKIWLRCNVQQPNYSKAKFPSNLNCGQKIVSETDPSCRIPNHATCWVYTRCILAHVYATYWVLFADWLITL